ncbi:malic enzyme-like NAD(P)-binding protein [Entomobacter blattae]|uniref:NADP-dependent malic enzyme n=1 Tax=Entomobacter blattae TaxID=2762277 RepID=A0A7H1NTN9_9PROT|nr:NADP-dependent malic enzyme [Entomobacter blattae]
MDNDFRKKALDYHRYPVPGKISVIPSKPLADRTDLSLAYTPGVAEACNEIKVSPLAAYDYTGKGNLVAVITNGTAVLGLGDIGPLAGKPVMEGKAVLFQKFAGVNAFDIEVDAKDPQKFCDVVAALEPTFGGINLEDIKAPECFAIEAQLKERMNIPVFHDDQHGTAIVVAAAVLNALKLQGKKLPGIRLVTSGAGAAALACVDMLVSLGLPVENVILTDIHGVIYQGREAEIFPSLARYAHQTAFRTLEDAIEGADIFLGLSAGGVFKPSYLARMAMQPIILAMANPVPEILPELVHQNRPDAIVGTGRSDYPNQVNNVLCFPFIFRGALDVGATEINIEMKHAAVYSIADLTEQAYGDDEEENQALEKLYGKQVSVLASDYILPSPFDPRLLPRIAAAVAKAAMETGVAQRPVHDLLQYQKNIKLSFGKTL